MINTPQKFAVSHLKEEDFKKDGLRSYATYRDLGFAKATHGLALAQVIRLLPPFDPEAAKLHLHNVDFQMVQPLILFADVFALKFCRLANPFLPPELYKFLLLIEVYYL